MKNEKNDEMFSPTDDDFLDEKNFVSSEYVVTAIACAIGSIIGNILSKLAGIL